MEKKLREIVTGDHVETTVLVKNTESKLKKNGEEYTYATITDGETDLGGSAWVPVSAFPCKGDVISLVIDAKDAGAGKVYYNLSGWKPMEGKNKLDFIRSAPVKPEDVYFELEETFENMNRHPLIKKVGLGILASNKDKLIVWTAAKNIHHNYLSGLIFHIKRMLVASDAIADTYRLDKELLQAGIILHDIGKINELSMDDFGNAEYTVDGRLFGHTALALIMIERACINLNIDAETEEIKLLEHMIACHHGKPEMGALKMPAIPEAFALHMLDMIDSRMWQYEEVSKGLKEGECSGRIFGLDGAIVYKPEATSISEEEAHSMYKGETNGNMEQDQSGLPEEKLEKKPLDEFSLEDMDLDSLFS